MTEKPESDDRYAKDQSAEQKLFESQIKYTEEQVEPAYTVEPSIQPTCRRGERQLPRGVKRTWRLGWDYGLQDSPAVEAYELEEAEDRQEGQ